MLPRVLTQVKLSENAMDSIPEAERWFRHSPKSLCESVENYADFCTHYSKTTYAEHLEVLLLHNVYYANTRGFHMYYTFFTVQTLELCKKNHVPCFILSNVCFTC